MLYLIDPFHGQISRRRWWLFQLIILVLAFAGMFVSIVLFSDPDAPTSTRNSNESTMLWSIIAVVIYLNFSACLNRLRDTGRSGLWYLAFMLPTVGTGLMICFCGIEAGDGGEYDEEISTAPPPQSPALQTAAPQNYSPRAQAKIQPFGRR